MERKGHAHVTGGVKIEVFVECRGQTRDTAGSSSAAMEEENRVSLAGEGVNFPLPKSTIKSSRRFFISPRLLMKQL